MVVVYCYVFFQPLTECNFELPGEARSEAAKQVSVAGWQVIFIANSASTMAR